MGSFKIIAVFVKIQVAWHKTLCHWVSEYIPDLNPHYLFSYALCILYKRNKVIYVKFTMFCQSSQQVSN
jgi:hypothetical protein